MATDFQGIEFELFCGLVCFLDGLSLSCRSAIPRFHARLLNGFSLQFSLPFAS